MNAPINTLAISALWYAYGYNDHRQPETGRPQPWVDPEQFARYFVALDALGSRPSIQDAFTAFRRQVEAGVKQDAIGVEDDTVPPGAGPKHRIR